MFRVGLRARWIPRRRREDATDPGVWTECGWTWTRMQIQMRIEMGRGEDEDEAISE